MELSSKVKYALVALLELASHHERGEPVQINQIAGGQQIPERYLEQLLTTLRRGGFVKSLRGAKGGYLLAKEPWQITVLEILACLDGTSDRTEESPPLSLPTPETYVILDVWQEATLAARAVFGRYTLQDLCQKRDDRAELNTMYYI